MKHLCDALFPGARVFVPGHSGESALLQGELAADPERARSVHFIGVQFPGIGSADYLSAHADARQTAFFMTPSVRAGELQGRAQLLSLDYAGVVRYLQTMQPVDVAIAQLTPPDDAGWCSSGLCSDFLPLVWASARRRIAHINPALPRTRGSFTVHVSELDGTVEAAGALVEFGGSACSAVEERIGAHVSSLVRDGDTLQFGIGSVPLAVARSLANHRRLRLHSGIVSQGVRALSDAGALDPVARITTGVALGSLDFYNEFVARQGQLWFTDVSRTHDVAAIGAIDRFIAINSAVEVDLFGQVNSERADGALQAGAGGLPAFAQGALRSKGGRVVICFAATAKRGAVSRIVPALGARSVCTLPRYMVDAIVTEHGVAELRGLSLDERAEALIGIAAAEHRAALSRGWDETRRDL